MSRLRELQNLYLDIGVSGADIIGDLQRLYSLPVGKTFSKVDIHVLFDKCHDKGVKVAAAKKVIDYERSLQDEFEKVKLDIRQVIMEDGNLNKLKGLAKNLKDISTAIQRSYLTLNGEWQRYESERSDLVDEMVEHFNDKGKFDSAGKLR